MSCNELAVTLLFLVICNAGCKLCISITNETTTLNTIVITESAENEVNVTLQTPLLRDESSTVPITILNKNLQNDNNETLNNKIEVSDSERLNTTITQDINKSNENKEDVRTEDKFKDGSSKNETVPWWRRRPYPLRQRARPCQCRDYKCGCCAGMEIQRLNISQQGCFNFKYDPDEFSIEMEMLMNNRALIRRSVSGKNPPPMCIPIPSLASFIPRIEFCARLFNIFTPGRNLHACLDWTTRVNSSPVLEIQFDCMRVGADGVAIVKPDAGGGLPDVSGVGGDYGVSEGEGAESEDYDPLDPEYPELGNKRPNKPTKPLNSTTTAAP